MTVFSTATIRQFGTAMLISVGVLSTPILAEAGSGDSVAVTYDIDVSGVQALQIQFDMDLSPTGYQSRATIDPQGIVAVFSDTHTVVGATGEIVNGKAIPAS